MKNLRILVIFVLTFFSNNAQSPSFDFIDSTLSEFNIRLVKESDRQHFTSYYCEFIDKLKKMSADKKKKELTKICSKAMSALEVKNSQWATQIKPYTMLHENNIHTPERTLVRRFLTRYGIHEEFIKMQACYSVNVWNRVKNYSTHMGSKVARWLHIKNDKITT